MLPFVVGVSDLNECATTLHKCVPNLTGGNCTNTYGSYECSCLNGYIGNGVQPRMAIQDNKPGSGCGKCS